MAEAASDHGHSHRHAAHPHGGHTHGAGAGVRALKTALALIVGFMVVEIVGGVLGSSLALLSDAAHMLTDAAALALSLFAARLASRPAAGAMTYGLGRAEILSAQANGLTMLVLALLIVYGAVRHLVTPVASNGTLMLIVALAGVAVNLVAERVLRGEASETERSLNVEGSYRHILTDLYGFAATAVAAAVILISGFHRADAIASLLIAGLMLYAAAGLLRASGRVMMEAAPAGVRPAEVGSVLAAQPAVAEIHDLHVWEVTSGFAAVSAHVIVQAGADCHEVRRSLARLLAERFGLAHSTLQVEHGRAVQPPLQIEVAPRESQS